MNVDELVAMNQRICGKEQVAKAVKEFWEDIGGMNDVEERADVNMSVRTRELRGLDGALRMAEVERVLKNLKSEKAASMDGIPY